MTRDEALAIVSSYPKNQPPFAYPPLYHDAEGFLEGFAAGETKGYEQGVRESAECASSFTYGSRIHAVPFIEIPKMISLAILALLTKGKETLLDAKDKKA